MHPPPPNKNAVPLSHLSHLHQVNTIAGTRLLEDGSLEHKQVCTCGASRIVVAKRDARGFWSDSAGAWTSMWLP